MTFGRRQFLKMALGSASLSAFTSLAAAETYPSRSVKVIVGFPAGGPVDIAARTAAAWLTDKFGQTFEVVNQPGESGNIATRTVLRSEPDGYTLLICGPVNAINSSLFANLDFDFVRDAEPIAALYSVPMVLEVNPSSEINSVAEFLDYARAHPGSLKVAYAGNGTPQHVGIELFKAMSGVDLSLVPYAGSSPALADLLAGRVDVMFDPLPSSIELVRHQKLKALAVTGAKRSPVLPELPCLSDYVSGYEAGSWFGIVAAKGVPASIVQKLNHAVGYALADPAARRRLFELGGTDMSGSPENFASFLVTETDRYRRLIRTANIKPNL
jgi:tripartite-type tricarboxylate transporter receptor subunit TctC